MRHVCCALAGLALASLAKAQDVPDIPAPHEPIPVLVVGTYHLSNPGLDRVNPRADDPRSPKRQREIASLVEQLAAFRPTKVLVEFRHERQPALDSIYDAYRAGTHELSSSEVQQVGLRLARRLDHRRVYGVDHGGGLAFDTVLAFAARHGQQPVVQDFTSFTRAIEPFLQRLVAEKTIGEAFRFLSDTAADEAHAVYLRLAEVGAGSDYPGADLTAAWYERNLRIFANIARVAEPGDRLLVLYGSGHAYLLRHYLGFSPRFRVVPIGEVLR